MTWLKATVFAVRKVFYFTGLNKYPLIAQTVTYFSLMSDAWFSLQCCFALDAPFLPWMTDFEFWKFFVFYLIALFGWSIVLGLFPFSPFCGNWNEFCDFPRTKLLELSPEIAALTMFCRLLFCWSIKCVWNDVGVLKELWCVLRILFLCLEAEIALERI